MERTQEGEFVVHHKKLIEYGIMTTKNSARVKDKLDALDLVEDVDYSLPNDVRPQWDGSCGTKHTKVYRRVNIQIKKSNLLYTVITICFLSRYVFQRTSLKNIEKIDFYFQKR